MSDENPIGPHQVWEAIIGGGCGGNLQLALAMITRIPLEEFNKAIDAINRETTVGPFLNPTAYIDGRRLSNAQRYIRILQAAGKLRAEIGAILKEEGSNVLEL